jgi:RsiW-degrading membrane proteinase PrsW (M82 family)
LTGTTLVLFSAAVTVVPVLVYVWILWLVDRYEKEPWSMLGAALLGGMVVAPILAMLLERLFGQPTSVYPALFQVYPIVLPSFAGAVIEEVAKAAVIAAAFIYLPHEFDGILDGVVYGATVGAGFALAESLIFVRDLVPLAASASVGPGLIIGVFVSGLTHCVFSGIFGASLGYTRETSASGSAAYVIPLVGLAAAALYHLGYVAAGAGWIAGLSGITAVLVGVARVVANWTGLLMLGVVVLWAWSRERSILRWALADETSTGVITADELSALATGGLRGGGGLRVALGELAFAKWRRSKGRGSDDDVAARRAHVLALRKGEGGGRA